MAASSSRRTVRTYTIDGDAVALYNDLDGEMDFTISYTDDGDMYLAGGYDFYQTEEEATAAIAEETIEATEEAQEAATENQSILMDNTWYSYSANEVDTTLTCAFTDTEITLDLNDPEDNDFETVTYQYKLLSGSTIDLTNDNGEKTCGYTLEQNDDGSMIFIGLET